MVDEAGATAPDARQLGDLLVDYSKHLISSDTLRLLPETVSALPWFSRSASDFVKPAGKC